LLVSTQLFYFMHLVAFDSQIFFLWHGASMDRIINFLHHRNSWFDELTSMGMIGTPVGDKNKCLSDFWGI
jgi:hypothetical protein